MKTVIWRWKGTRAEIVRIANAVAEQASGPNGPFVAEIADGLGTQAVSRADDLGPILEGREKFNALAILGGHDQGPCQVSVLFADPAVAGAAVTIQTTGADQAAVLRAHGAISQAAKMGEREPKDVEPSTVEMWAAIFTLICTPLGVLLTYLGYEGGEVELALIGTVLFGAGTVGGLLWLAYEMLIPQIELLHPGQSPRIVKVAGAAASIVAGLFLAAILGTG